MPRAAAFKISALAELLRQLEYAPPETRRRQMDAAERLIADLDPDRAYPEEFIIFRITGYRSDSAAEPVTFVGAALRADLANLVQRLSGELDLPPRRNGSAALALEDVAARLNVSTKTIQRYRTQGLVCHVVKLHGGDPRLACYEDALQRFTATRSDHLAKAARFTRISHDTEAIIVDEARRLRLTRGLSLNVAAAIIAKQHSRALETIRQMLRRHDRAAAAPIFHEPGPLRQRDIRVIHRGWMRGIDLGPLAERFGKSRATMHRAITRRRAERLCSLDVTFVPFPTFEMEGAETVILSPAIVSRDLLKLPPHREGTAILEWAKEQEAIAEETEDALLAAWNFLKMRVAKGIDAIEQDQEMDHLPGSDKVDAIETDLRWAALLHRHLALLALPATIRRIEANLGRSMIVQPAEQIVALLRLAVEVVVGRDGVGGSLASVDPGRGQKLERIAAFDMERELAKRGITSSATRAAARHQLGAIPLTGLLDGLDPWMKWLNPWNGARDLVAKLPGSSRDLLVQRYGWAGDPPRTMAWLARDLKLKPTAIARRVQRAIRELRVMIRGASQG